MKKFLVVANWKMNPFSFAEAELWVKRLKKDQNKFKNLKILVAPPFLYAFLFKNLKKIEWGAQNCFWEERGHFTGEISPLMLKNAGCSFVIVGHSERRIYLREDKEMINKKLKIVLKNKLIPLLCFGEGQKEKNLKKRIIFLKKEIFQLTQGIPINDFKKIIFAYEPLFAIGTGLSCPPEYAKETLTFLRGNFPNKILYGGSVSFENFHLYLQIGFEGLLIGQSSLKIEEFLKILNGAEKWAG